VIPGSHRSEVAGVRDNIEVESVLGKEIAVEVDESAAVDMVLAPGDVEVHHRTSCTAATRTPRRTGGAD
jgi:hypothetical protein